jgi:large subunit ribosomal protein L10
MKQEEKSLIIDAIAKDLADYPHVYITDMSGFTVETVTQLRRICYRRNIKLKVVKNTLLKRAMEQSSVDYSEIYPALKGVSSIMLSENGSAPAKLIKEFRAKRTKPMVKAAFIE